MLITAKNLKELFHQSHRPIWQCLRCQSVFVRTEQPSHVCLNDVEVKHTQECTMSDRPLYTCKTCGFEIVEPVLPFPHECSGTQAKIDAEIARNEEIANAEPAVEAPAEQEP